MILDFEAELAKFLDQPAMQAAFHSFAAQQIKSGAGGTGGTAQVKADATKFAIEARRAIIASLPPALRHKRTGMYSVGSDRPITEGDLILSEPEATENGDFVVRLSWNPAAIYRESLYEEGYPNGVEDIVAVFTSSKERKNYVYGYWHDSPHSVRSRKTARRDTFIQDAISSFNASHRGDRVKIVMEDPRRYS